MGQQQTAAPDTLPANFGQWDKAPDTLPASHTQWDSAPVLKENGQVVPEGGFGVGHYLKQSIPSGSDLLHALGLPASQDEAYRMATDEAAHPVSSAFNRIKSFLYGGPAADAVISMGKEAVRGVKGTFSDDPKEQIEAPLHMASAMNPLAAPVVDAMSERGLGTKEANATGVVNAAPMVAGEVAPRVVPPVVRGAAKGVNTVLEKAPGSLGAGLGTAVAHYIPGVPAWMGSALGYGLGKELFPALKIPGEKFGLSDPQIGLFDSLKKVNDSLPANASVDSHPATHQAVKDAIDTLLGQKDLDGPDTIPHTASGDIVMNQALTALDKPTLMRIAKARGIDTTAEANLIDSKAESSLVKKISADLSPDELSEAREMGLELSRNKPVYNPNTPDAAGQEAWHYKVLKQFFPDVDIPKAMAKRAQATIANRPGVEAYTDAAKQNLPKGAPEPVVKQEATRLQSEDGDLADLLEQSIAAVRDKKNGK